MEIIMNRNRKWFAVALLAALTTGILASLRLFAADVAVYTDGLRYEGEVRLVNQSAYVSLREFACAVDNSVVTWEAERNTATVTTDSLTLTAEKGANYMIANGRYLWCADGIFTDRGSLYVPLQRVAQAFGFSSRWSFADNTSYLTRKRNAIETADVFYDADELYWLSRIIHAEAQGEPFEGKLAVGSVIMNRIDAEEFPDALYDVIFDDANGVQFTPTANGAIANEPNADSVAAAKLCLDGFRISNEILYFLNPDVASNFWVVQNCAYVMSVGSHDFYS